VVAAASVNSTASTRRPADQMYAKGAQVLSSTLFRAVAAVVLGWAALGCQSTGSSANKGKPLTADEAFEKGQELPPTPRTMYASAKILAAQGRDAESETALRTLMRDHPKFSPAYNALAELQMRHRRVEDAQITLDAGLKIAPRDPILLNNLGMCRMTKNDFSGALAAYTKAASAAPDNARYRGNMAAALGMMGRYEESLALYQQILSTADAHYNVARLREARRVLLGAAAENDMTVRTVGEIGGFSAQPGEGAAASRPGP